MVFGKLGILELKVCQDSFKSQESSSTWTSDLGLYEVATQHVTGVSCVHATKRKSIIKTLETLIVYSFVIPLEMSEYTDINVKVFTLCWRDSVGYSCCQAPLSFTAG